jgi:hypothetical protein
MLDELPHRHLYPTKKKFWMQRLRTKKGVLPPGGRTSCVTKISVVGKDRRNARKDDTLSVPLALETEPARGQGGQVGSALIWKIVSVGQAFLPVKQVRQECLTYFCTL